MPRALFDAEYIFGIHEPGGEQHMLAAGRPGWIVFTEAVGHDPEDHSGLDFSTYSDLNLGIICRINHGYEPMGTLPHSSLHEQFARRVAHFVETSRGCKTWVIGNEMNYAVERPGIVIDWSRHHTTRTGPPDVADPLRRGLGVRFNVLPDQSTEIRTTRGAIVSPGELITPERYARCYRLCRDAIHNLAGHANDRVLVGPVAPWNTQTIYPGNPNGDWVLYFRHILDELAPDQCDGFALHAFTQSGDLATVSSSAKLPPPFQNHHGELRAFTDFLNAVPASMRHLPAFITELGQVTPWIDRNDGWVQRAYAEIDSWNRQPGVVQVHAAALYRWPRIDRWHIDGKQGVVDDFCAALTNDYRVSSAAETPALAVAPTPVQATAEQGAVAPAADATPVAAAPPEQEVATAGAEAAPARRSQRRPRRLTDGPTPPAYFVHWLEDRFPEDLHVGETVVASITLRNEGSLTWRCQGGNPFRLGYHYYRGRRLLPIPDDRALRTDLPADVPPGATVTLDLLLALPTEPGNYTVELDLVHEGVGWFKERKSPVLTRWLTVESPPHQTTADGSTQAVEARNLPVPLFADISATLPRSNSPYARRNLNQIRYLVISHTGANPGLGLEHIARAHIQAGYPGIAYDFVVASNGQVFRVSPLESVAQPDQAWSEQGVNIALAGSFGASTPPLAQLDATGRLCAWLSQNLGLSPDAIVGLGELTRSDSPGLTFYRGAAWKEMIIRQVQLHHAALGMGAAESSQMETVVAQTHALEDKNRALVQRNEDLQKSEESLQAANQRLQGELLELQRQIEQAGVRGTLTVPLENVVAQLPRLAGRYHIRRPADVHHIVVNHTGMPEATPLTAIAEAHLRDWPGLLYDFCIDAQGKILQTQPLEEVVASSEPYLANAINLAFLGNFERSQPTREQINAGGRLIAWLLDQYPALALENVVGMNELVSSSSPGAQWLGERGWKEKLLAAVRRISGLTDSSEVEAELRRRVGELEAQVEQAQRLAHSLQEVRTRLEAELLHVQTELDQKTQVGGAYVVPKPPMRSIIDQLARHPTLRYERRALSQITHIAVHHTAAPPSMGPQRIAELHVQADPVRGKEPWPGIGYHFFIHADGAIEQLNQLETICYHVYKHNHYTVGVVFAGSFMNGKIPTSAQLRSGAHLLAWLMQELKAPLARVWGHREYPDNVTVCPGSEWTQGNRWRDLLFERVEQAQTGVGVKSMRHYVLLWQRPYPGPMARQELIGAIGYVTRFRPTVGFSVDDARNAEYVTIVGGEAGVNAAVEKMLVEHGCRVERIAGRDEEETVRILADLARQGRRFRAFDVDF